jgi:hypothetical protein
MHTMNRSGYVDVDRLQAETTLDAAAAKCGAKVEVKGGGREVRIDCPFGCAGDHSGRKEVAINIENPQKVFMCHAYQCKFRGNLLTLMHGWLTGTKPTGEKLKGQEFQRVRNVLAGEAPPAVARKPAARSASQSRLPCSRTGAKRTAHRLAGIEGPRAARHRPEVHRGHCGHEPGRRSLRPPALLPFS